MQQVYSFRRRLAVLAGLSLSSFVLAGASSAMIASDDHETVVQANKKIRIVKAGGQPNTFHIEHASSKAREEAIQETETALEKVETRLKKASKKAEREALEAARNGLVSALEALRASAEHLSFAYASRPSAREMREIELSALEGALTNMEEQLSDLGHVRIDIKDDLADARASIAEAMADIEIEVDLDGERHEHHVRGLEEAAAELERMEEHQLEGLKRAEERLQRERERLEQRLEERRQRQSEEAAQQAEEAAKTPEGR